jgi:hypothetical protein
VSNAATEFSGSRYLTMRSTTRKAVIRISILLVAGLAFVFVGSFVSRSMYQNSFIDSLLTSDKTQTEIPDSRCDPVVFAITANGDVYSGKDLIGSMANPLDLPAKMKKAIEASAARFAYTPGMDLSLEVPQLCADEPVYIKTEGHVNDGRVSALIRALREVGVNPKWRIAKRKPQQVIH